MFHRHAKRTPGLPEAAHRTRTVRLLQDHEELEAAVKRAQEFERKGITEYERRLGAYDRFLRPDPRQLADVVPIESKAAED